MLFLLFTKQKGPRRGAARKTSGECGQRFISLTGPVALCSRIMRSISLKSEEGRSPGTVFLWDSSYKENYPDLPYIPAAAVCTRVISHPAPGVFTFDLGCKGIASDPPGVRGKVVGLENAEPMFQSEEHWTWRMKPGFENERPKIGDVFYVIPTHICPTTALYSEVPVAENHVITEHWTVDARR